LISLFLFLFLFLFFFGFSFFVMRGRFYLAACTPREGGKEFMGGHYFLYLSLSPPS